MVDPTFNREKAEAVLRQWWSAYGVNQAPVNANTQRPDFAENLIQQSDPERGGWFDDKNSVIGKIERILSRGVSTTDVLQTLGNISAEVEWKTGGSGTPEGISQQLDKRLTTSNIDKQLAVTSPDALGGTGFTDKELTKKYDQFIGRILPKTTAGLSLSGFDSNVQTNLRNTINQMGGMDAVKEKVAQAFAAGVNDKDEPIDFANEDTILKSISNVNHNWGDKSTTSNLAARDLAIASLFLSKTPSSPSQYTSWLNNTFKDAASSSAYQGDPMGHAGKASTSNETGWKSKFSQNILDNESSGRWGFDGFIKGSTNQVGQFTDQQGNKIKVAVKGQITDIGPQNQEVTTEIPSQIIPPDADWRQVIAERNAKVAENRAHNDQQAQIGALEVSRKNAQTAADRAEADATYQEGQLSVAEGKLELAKTDSEWTQTFSETKHQAEMDYKNKVAGHERWYQINKIAGESADREMRGKIAEAQNQLAVVLHNASAQLQTGISDAQIASREKIAKMAYDDVTADTAARLTQAGLELDFQTAKWADQLGLAEDAQALEENKFQFNKEHLGAELAQKVREFDELSAAEDATLNQRFQFFSTLSAAEKATLAQNDYQFANLSAAEAKNFKQDMFKFQNISAGDQASLDLQEQMFTDVSGNTQATLDQDLYKFQNIAAVDAAQLAQDESQFGRNLEQDESQFVRNIDESGRQFNIGESGDTLRTQIGTQPALMGAITDRDRLMNEMLSQGGNYLARAFNQYGQSAPTDQPSVADRINSLRAQTVEQNALAQMGADSANEAIKQSEYQKYMQTAAQGAQARWDEYVGANTSTVGGGTYEFANPNFNADDIATQRANLTAAAQEAQAKADYFSGTDYTDPTSGQVYEADIFPQGVPDIGFQAKAAQPHLDAATAAQAALNKYQAPNQFVTGTNPSESVYTGMNRNQWDQQYGQANNMQDWWNTVADQSAIQPRFAQPDMAPVQPMTSMEELVAMSRGFLSPAAQDVYFGGAARPKTGFGFALPSYQQLQRLAPEERDALNTAMLTEFNVPLSNAVYEERLRGQPTRTSAPAASQRPTQMFRRSPYQTTNTGLRQSTAPMGQVREASRQPMFRSS